VLDQTLKHNSSISFVNTNVWREGDNYDANVSAGLFEFFDKKNTWNLGGKFAVSNRFNYLPEDKTQAGFSHELHFGKSSGRFNFSVSQERTDTNYSSNDMGYFTNNNYLKHDAWVEYKWTEPKNWYNRIFLNLNGNLNYLSKKIAPADEMYQNAEINFNINIQSKKLWWIEAHTDYSFRENDFYEPRTPGWYFKRGASIGLGASFESNDSKKYSWSANVFTRTRINFYEGFNLETSFHQQMRFNNKFSLGYSINFEPHYNDVGYVYIDSSTDINFAKRRINTIEQILSAKYSFTNKMGITFRVRHYLSTVENKEFYLLQPDGSLLPHSNFHPDANQNVNYFNIDMVYTWEFAPGSFLNIVWKNAAQNFTNDVEKEYFKNLGNTIDGDSNNNFSVKVIFFLDYLKLKKYINNLHKKS
jgi:hypothetical protein